jgi:hypothetical protein
MTRTALKEGGAFVLRKKGKFVVRRWRDRQH